MKVFISWSGVKSKTTATVLSSWIRQVIQAAETWISLDIDKGTRWNDKLNKELEQTKVGIICLNRENLTSEWILFEAGALSKTNDAHVCTFLLDVSPSDIKPPLGQFQHTLFTKEDVKKLIQTINNKVIEQGEKSIPEKDLEEVFEINWARLEEKLNNIKSQGDQNVSIHRSDREILEEILQTVRAMDLKSALQDSIFEIQKVNEEINKEKIFDEYTWHNHYFPRAKYLKFSDLLKNLNSKKNGGEDLDDES